MEVGGASTPMAKDENRRHVDRRGRDTIGKNQVLELPSVEFTIDIADICSTKGSREGEMAKRCCASSLAQADAVIPWNSLNVNSECFSASVSGVPALN